MPLVELSPGRVIVDGRDVSDFVTAYRLESVGGDVPVVVLELVPGLRVAEIPAFTGVANVRIAARGLDAVEFLNGVDPELLENEVLEGDYDESPITTALKILRKMAADVSP